MNTKMTIKIKKRSQPGYLVWLLIILPLLLGTLNDLLGLPYAIRYLLDGAWFVLLMYLARFYRIKGLKGSMSFVIWIGLFLAYVLLVYLVQYQSALYFLWGVRNTFRFYVAFLSFAAFLTEKDVEDYLKLFDKLFWVNVVVSLIQYFGFGIEQDSLGGIFGITVGCNGYSNIFFLIVLAKSVVFYLEKKETLWRCVSKCIAALGVAALAEMKALFVEFLVIIVLAVLFTNFTWRKFWIIIGGIATVAVGATLLAVVFPMNVGWFSVEWMLDVVASDKGYTSSGDLNRLNAISQINELWLTNWGQRIFGLGMGNCDTSSFAFINTPFFEANGDMHYTWISYAMMYLECGWIGLIFYIGFFGLVYLSAYRIEKRSEGITRTYCRISRIFAVCCVIISIYNSSLRMEPAYMAYFVLAIPFVIGKRKSGVTASC